MLVSKDGHTYEIRTERVEVTSSHRPDERWVFTDHFGHEHRWRFIKDGKTITDYRPDAVAVLDTLSWHIDGYYEEDVPYGHYECKGCGGRVEPGYRADEFRRYIAGLSEYLVDGQTIDRAGFIDAVVAAGLTTRKDLEKSLHL